MDDTCSAPGIVAFTLDIQFRLLALYLVSERWNNWRNSTDKELEGWMPELSQSNYFAQLHLYYCLYYYRYDRLHGHVALEFPNWNYPKSKYIDDFWALILCQILSHRFFCDYYFYYYFFKPNQTQTLRSHSWFPSFSHLTCNSIASPINLTYKVSCESDYCSTPPLLPR